MVKFLHEVIDFLIVIIPDPRQEIVDTGPRIYMKTPLSSSMRPVYALISVS
jgi:hypothetical protein